MYQIHHVWMHSLPAIFLPTLLIPGTVSTGFIFAYAYMCIHYLWHLPPPTGATPSPTSRQNLFHPPILWFCGRKNKKGKKNMAFLLVWDKYIYTGRFLVLFPCIYVLQPKLIHLYQSSSLLFSHLPIVASASLRLLYLFLYSEHINHIQVFGFLPPPYPSDASFIISVTCVQ
jgi:hypothetical protein